MEKYTLTTEAIEAIIRLAFSKGETWGVTYGGWFSPTEKETEGKKQIAVKEILTQIKNELEG